MSTETVKPRTVEDSNDKVEEDLTKNGEEDVVEFHSSEILLEYTYRELEGERNRKNTLETRAGIFVTILSTFVVLFLSSFKIKVKFPIESKIQFAEATIIILSFVGICIGTIFAFHYFLRTLKTGTYNKVDVKEFTENAATFSTKDTAVALLEMYRENVLDNEKVNDNKVENYDKGINWVIVALVSVAIHLLTIAIF